MSEAISFSTRFCAAVGWKGRIFLDGGARAIIQLKSNPGLRLLFATFQLEAQFHEKQFLENEANVGRGAGRLQILNAFAGIGPVNLLQSLARRNQAQMAAHDRRDGVGQFRRKVFERGVDDAPKPARSQTALSRRLINRHDAANLKRSRQLLVRGVGGAVRFPDNLELRLGELQFAFPVVLLYLAVERNDLPGLELVLKIRSIEPDTFQPRPALPRSHLKDGHAAGAEQA